MHGVEHVFGFHVAYGEVFGILGELFVEALLDQLRTQLKSLRWIHARTEFAWRLFLRRRRYDNANVYVYSSTICLTAT